MTLTKVRAESMYTAISLRFSEARERAVALAKRHETQEASAMLTAHHAWHLICEHIDVLKKAIEDNQARLQRMLSGASIPTHMAAIVLAHRHLAAAAEKGALRQVIALHLPVPIVGDTTGDVAELEQLLRFDEECLKASDQARLDAWEHFLGAAKTFLDSITVE